MKRQHSVRVGLAQFACSDQPRENLDRGQSQVVAAARAGAQIICLPELFASRYFCQVEDPTYFDLAEPRGGPNCLAFQALAEQLSVVIIYPYFERRAAGIYHNSAVIIDADGSIAGHYRKMHIPDDPQYYEKFYFTPGDEGFQAVVTKYATVGILICWDQWYPEAARLTALKGAEILFYPTAIGWLPEDKPTVGRDQQNAWQTVQRGHAVANGVFVAACNRVGFEPSGSVDGGSGIEFWGASFVADPQGVILQQGGQESENLLVDCDLGRLEEVRRLWPFLRDRRIDGYGEITRRYLD